MDTFACKSEPVKNATGKDEKEKSLWILFFNGTWLILIS